MLFEHRVNFDLKKGCTALLVTDMQNDFLTPGGKYYVMIEELMKRNNVNSNLESLLQAAKTHDLPVFMSPHYFYPHDHKLNTHLGPMEDLALNGGVVARQSPIESATRRARGRIRRMVGQYGGAKVQRATKVR